MALCFLPRYAASMIFLVLGVTHRLNRHRARIDWANTEINGHDLRRIKFLSHAGVSKARGARIGYRGYLPVSNPRSTTDGVPKLHVHGPRWFRHPSYAGFFYWALGTQLVLQNPVSFSFFLVVLWRFFHSRIKSKCSVMMQRYKG